MPYRVLPEPSPQELLEKIEAIERSLAGKGLHIQYGFVVLEWPGGTQEAGPKKIVLSPTAEGRVAFLQGFASGQFFLAFVSKLVELELEVGCATTDHSLPPAGTKQTIAWIVLSP